MWVLKILAPNLAAKIGRWCEFGRMEIDSVERNLIVIQILPMACYSHSPVNETPHSMRQSSILGPISKGFS